MGRDSTVLVGVDGSAPSRRALAWAVQEAHRHGWGLRLVCTYALPSFSTAAMDGGYAFLDDSAIRDGAQGVLDDALAHVADQGLEVTGELATGDAAGVLVELSREVALTVVGTRGRGGFADRLLGTVSSALPAHAHAPTVVVPLRGEVPREAVDAVGGLFGPTAPPPLATVGTADTLAPASGQVPVVEEPATLGPGPAAAGASSIGGFSVPWADRRSAAAGALRPVRSIVVGVDGSRQAERALRYAAREAEVWGAQLTAVAAVPLAAANGVLAWLPAVVDHEQILADSREQLDAVVDRVLGDRPGLAVRRIVLDGTGAQLLTEFSTATDLVVLGSRGRGGFAGLLLGSTSQAVLHHARCAVMVVTDRSDDVPPF